MKNDGWYSTRRYADMRGLHIKTVQRYAREGVLDSKKVGGRVYVREKDDQSQAGSCDWPSVTANDYKGDSTWKSRD